MILIVDSGATKSDWIALDEKGEQLFLTQTLGLSPEVLTREVIEDRLANNFELSKNREKVTRLYFYGAGCGTDRAADGHIGEFHGRERVGLSDRPEAGCGTAW